MPAVLILISILLLITGGAVAKADTSTAEQFCVLLLDNADSPVTYRYASDECLQAAARHKERADSASGERRQQELLFQAGFMILAAEAESHGGDADVESQLLTKARGIALSVYAHTSNVALKSQARKAAGDAEQMLGGL